MSKNRNAAEYLSVLDDLMGTLEEGDFFHNDPNRDRMHDKVGRAAQKPPQSCPPGHVRNRATGHCVALRGKLNR